MDNTKIQWADATWNPLFGCTKIACGCVNCYAETLAKGRLQRYGIPDFKGSREGQHVVQFPDRLDQPLRWKKPRRIFVNSLSDLFHEEVPNEFIASVFGVMASAPQHTFLVLTKRPERMLRLLTEELVFIDNPGNGAYIRHDSGARWIAPPGNFPARNVWLGVSVSDQRDADRNVPPLLATPAAVRFVSFEPALGPVDFGYRGAGGLLVDGGGDAMPPQKHAPTQLDWIIVGGESGGGARPFDLAWARSAIEQGRAAGVPVFVKQLGSAPMVGLASDAYQNLLADHEPTVRFQSSDGSTFRRDARGLRLGHWLSFADRKGGDMAEWPADLRVREWPEGRA